MYRRRVVGGLKTKHMCEFNGGEYYENQGSNERHGEKNTALGIAHVMDTLDAVALVHRQDRSQGEDRRNGIRG